MILLLRVVTSFLIVASTDAVGGRRERLQLLKSRRAAAAELATPVVSLSASGEGEKLSDLAGEPDVEGEAVAAEKPAGRKEKEEGQNKGEKFKAKWLTFWYWKPLLVSLLYMLLVVDVGGPIIDRFFGFSLQKEVCLLVLAIYGFAIVVFMLMDPRAAGMKNLLAVATIGCTVTLLLVLLTLSFTLSKTDKSDPLMLLATDVAGLIRPFLHLIVVVIMLDVVSTEASVDWGKLALLLGFLMLGIALSLSGVIGDILAHVFLRMDGHFREGDFIIYDGGLVQIVDMKWRHVIGITEAQNAIIYIPNAELTSLPLVNQSQDSDRCVEVDILVNLDAASLKQAVKNAWDLLAQTEAEDFTFTGSNGTEYTNQFNTPECAIWVNENGDTVHIKFTGSYFFSAPPPYQGDDEEPAWIDRQEDWENGWQMQVEWYNIQLKKMNESLGAWPYYPEDSKA